MSFHDRICRRLDGISKQTSGGTKKITNRIKIKFTRFGGAYTTRTTTTAAICVRAANDSLRRRHGADAVCDTQSTARGGRAPRGRTTDGRTPSSGRSVRQRVRRPPPPPYPPPPFGERARAPNANTSPHPRARTETRCKPRTSPTPSPLTLTGRFSLGRFLSPRIFTTTDREG